MKPEIFSDLIESAIELSAQWHDQTYRKKRWRDPPFEVPPEEILRVPVSSHVTMVAMIVQRAGWDEKTIAAAFVHDVLEDANRFGQTMRAEQLREALGDEVLAIVRQVTEQRFDENDQPIPWKIRKEAYVAGLKDASAQAAAVSLADKIHNLWSINKGLGRGVDVFARDAQGRGLSGGPEEQLWFHQEVLRATEQYGDPRLIPMRGRLSDEVELFREYTDLR